MAASTALATALALAVPAVSFGGSSHLTRSAGASHLKGWDINDWGALPRPGDQFYRDLRWAKRAHADVVRIPIDWRQIEDARDVRWMTRYLHKIHRLGMKIDLLVERGTDPSMDSHPEQFAADCAKAAQLWKRHLTAIEVGNEPNALFEPSMTRADFERADAQAAAAYVPLVKDSYLAIKQVAPRVAVLAGALAFSDGIFLDDAYIDGMGDYFDALSVHPYTYDASPRYVAPASVSPSPTDWMFSLVDGLPWIHRIMAAHGDGQKMVWITEVGWNTQDGTVPDAQRARYVGQLGALTRGWPWLAAVMFYELRDQGPSSDRGWAFVSRSWKPSRSFWAVASTTF